MKYPRPHTGFTLLEMVIALGIFGILSVTVIAIFMTSGREERRGVKRQQGVASARFILESMAKDIRLGNVNYTHYAATQLVDTNGVRQPVSVLALTLQDGSPYYYRCIAREQYFDGVLVGTAEVSCLYVLSLPVEVRSRYTLKDAEIQTSSDGLTWSPVSVDDITVSTFAIYIDPGTDPFAANATTRIQPRVTIAMTVEAATGNEPKTPTLIQTTVTPRRNAGPAL